MLTTSFMKNYSEAKVKVREATSTNPWVSLSEIMDVIYHRMNDCGKNWRQFFKCLMLLDCFINSGSEQVTPLSRGLLQH
uniref:ENTH domain-containing protein n=1 Tax=Anser cygnoides TaxID=8845 RepID=A0A8B9DWK0_ANSCY